MFIPPALPTPDMKVPLMPDYVGGTASNGAGDSTIDSRRLCAGGPCAEAVNCQAEKFDGGKPECVEVRLAAEPVIGARDLEGVACGDRA